MDSENAQGEYTKFFALMLFFAALVGAAALVRPALLGTRPVAAPTPTLFDTTYTPTTHQQMLLPSATPTAAESPTPLPTPLPPAPSPTPAPQIYIVQPGDNLYRLGLKFSVSIDELATANQIANRNLLLVGQQLIIPAAGAAATPPPVPVQTAVPTAEPAPAGRTYTVRWGDTLWAISRQYGVDVNALAATNGISDPTRLQVGTVLTIPDS